MDHPKAITHIGLCAGYGGIELGLKRVLPNLRSVALCEIEAYACANLVSKMEAGLMDAAPIWTNLKTFPWAEFRDRVDILTGGYPCQPFSAAGKRLGTDDPRHLWPFIADGIRAMQPGLCFFENVEGHISLGLRAVVEELEGIGYRTTWGIFSAAEVGAPHRRKRVFIMADRFQSRLEGHAGNGAGCFRQVGSLQEPDRSVGAGGLSCWPSRPGQPQHGWEPPRVVGNTTVVQRHGGDNHAGSCDCGQSLPESQDAGGACDMGHAIAGRYYGLTEPVTGEHGQGADRPSKSGEICMGEPMQSGLDGTTWQGLHGEGRTSLKPAQGRIRQAQPPLGGDADGPAGRMDYGELCIASDNRTDELRLLGNGVVPATAELAFKTLLKELTT
jgi:DNA (cytosine-5)-methyltransferase 1